MPTPPISRSQLDLPVVLVVGMRLGCISHALLTAEAIVARGLRLAGWVANHVDPDMRYPDENIEAIRLRLDVSTTRRCSARVPHLAPPVPGTAATISIRPCCCSRWRGQRGQ